LLAVRRHLRLVVTLRGGCWVVALLLFATALGGLVDWRFHLPALVRAFLLTSTLGAAGYVGHRYLVQPLLAKTDDLSLALLLETHYPVLNDSLASALQFLEQQKEVVSGVSSSLRREAVRRALEVAKVLDFHAVVDRRGSRLASFSALVAGALALGLCLAHP